MVKKIILVLMIFQTASCSHLLYAPTNHFYFDPKAEGLDIEEVVVPVTASSASPKNSEERSVVGWYFHTRKVTASKKPKAIWVFFHGNGENLSSHYKALTWVLDQGYDFFIFDYEGYGPSKGSTTPQVTVEDGQAVMKWIAQKNLPVIVFGQSLGGAVAMRTLIDLRATDGSALKNLKALILDSTFESYDDATASVLSSHWLTWTFQPLGRLLISDKYAPDGKLQELGSVPKLVMHGTADPVIGYDLGQELYKNLPEPKVFLSIEGGKHIDGFWRENGKYQQLVLEWLGRQSI